MVVLRLDPHDAGRHGRAKPHREHGAKHDGHLPEDVARVTLAEDALDPVDEPGRLDAPLEHGEERALSALGRRVLSRHEAHIRRHPGEPLTLGQVETREKLDATDFLGRHHVGQSRRRRVDPVPLHSESQAP